MKDNRVIVVSAELMKRLEAAAVADGDSYENLMERAGSEVARLILSFGDRRGTRALVLAGPGNNGGDALVVARHLADNNWDVRVKTILRRAGHSPHLSRQLLQRRVMLEPLERVDQLVADLEWCNLIVDGLFCTGLQRDVTGLPAAVIESVNQARRDTICIDIPSGVDSDTGQIRGTAIRGTSTIALGFLKYGHALSPGKQLSGKILLGDIGLSTQITSETGVGRVLDDNWARKMLPERPEDSNKGTFGKAMVVAGSINYIGAAALAVEGAMRSGAGLVTLGCPGDLLSILAVKLTECTFLPLPSDLGAFSMPAAEKLRSALEGYSALLVGCGLGQEKETAAFIRKLLAKEEVVTRTGSRTIGFANRLQPSAAEIAEAEKGSLPTLVLDGDALNLLAEIDDWQSLVPADSVLTPHPGEMARLLKITVEEVQADRARCAADAAVAWKQVVVLKGASTVIASPDGDLLISPFANAALASAGTGDVLAGVIVGLIAQGKSTLDAASLGVYLHGLAGEALSEEFGPSGGLAGDLPVLVARARKQLRDKPE
jgi:ADP-dependent NAD(P)H-hydrate dehydratase / NAD(P)H-hydrate epimerase